MGKAKQLPVELNTGLQRNVVVQHSVTSAGLETNGSTLHVKRDVAF